MTNELSGESPAFIEPTRVGWWYSISKYSLGLAPFVVVWAILVGWLSWLLYSKSSWLQEADEANMREWIEETRTFRRTLPELVRDYIGAVDGQPAGTVPASLRVQEKREELEEQLHALVEPTRAYESKLPLFPVVYSIDVTISGEPPTRISWINPMPRPRQQNQTYLRRLELEPLGVGDRRAVISCEYTLHAFNKLQRDEQNQQRVALIAQVVLLVATLIAGMFVYRFLRRELLRERERLSVVNAAEKQERELLRSRIRQQDTERVRDELNRRVLQQELDSANLQKRADEAEKSALAVKGQLYAGISIMAGSYAHNIKNLLVRPNNLLARSLEAADVSAEQQERLREVQGTLSTVTERLQQILKTIRRDTGKPELVPIDLALLLGTMQHTWRDTADEKWKLELLVTAQSGDCRILGDESHLHQAIENLIFNARDATFEMRSAMRDAARAATAGERKQRLIAAAGWRGRVRMNAFPGDTHVTLTVQDNGLGMTDEVRRQCMTTHFTTKRDNALFEGYSAGMGLGLSFVAMVLDFHSATIDIATEPGCGATFTIRFPKASTAAEAGRD